MYFSIKEFMLRFIYNILIFCAQFILRGVALFNTKIYKGVQGRKDTYRIIKDNISATDKTIWFHCASLGEYEQGLPVFKNIRQSYPKHKIVLSFFSPSGYDVRKDTDIADCIVYLPLDTKKNAEKFITLVNPELTIFVKYDIWPNFLETLKKRQKKAILISALFRPNQTFFKFYGNHFRQALFAFEHIFVQNEESKILLSQINYTHVTVSGDTRFDRVYNQLEQNNTIDFIAEFKQNAMCVVAGSTWADDEAILIDYINANASKDIKFVIAPHNIHTHQIERLKKQLRVSSVAYTQMENQDLASFKVFILDTIGLLSKTYAYADIAYVGGAMGKTGLHNTLEPAVFGIPIIIGNRFKNFPEAIEMQQLKGLFSVQNRTEVKLILDQLLTEPEIREESGLANARYIEKNKGSVIQIMNFLRI